MKIIGVPFKQGSRIPGCELGIYYILDALSKSSTFSQNNIIVFENLNSKDNTKIVYSSIKKDKRILFVGSNHASTGYIIKNYVNFKYDKLFI